MTDKNVLKLTAAVDRLAAAINKHTSALKESNSVSRQALRSGLQSVKKLDRIVSAMK
jgi:hypothetical protein